ncbi:MAG: DUF4878 domain-containing protein [Paludibacteraceae bacterium]|nr:DUF4878 domain-containing protein [Paludibacteraceae bacterium]
MKKILGILSLALVMFGFAACNSATSSPENVVKAYYDALQKGEVEKAIDLMHFKGEMTQEQKDEIVATFNDKLAMVNNHHQGIAAVEVGEVEMAEDGEHAVVKIKIIYGDEQTKEDTEKVIKVDGKWFIDAAK